MNESIHAFTMQLGYGKQAFSIEEYSERRKALWQEVKALMPAFDKLPNSQLVDRIGIQNDKHVLHFCLEFTGQLSLPSGRNKPEALKTILEHDLSLLRESAKNQQRTIFLEAQHREQFGTAHARSKSTKSDIALRALMKRHRGESLSLDFSDGLMNFHFPDHPAFRCDGEVRVISARIEKICPISANLASITYMNRDEAEIKILGKAKRRIALLPPEPNRSQIGMRCAETMFKQERISFRVRTALDYLTDRISHYEIDNINC